MKLHNTLNEQNALEIKEEINVWRPKKVKAKDKNQPKLDNYIQGKKEYKNDQSMDLDEK